MAGVVGWLLPSSAHHGNTSRGQSRSVERPPRPRRETARAERVAPMVFIVLAADAATEELQLRVGQCTQHGLLTTFVVLEEPGRQLMVVTPDR